MQRALLAVVCALAATLSVSPASAHAASSFCNAAMSGDWRNTNPNPSSATMSRVVVDYTCNHLSCPIGGPCGNQTSYYSMRPFTRCSPTDCDLGRQRAEAMDDGSIGSTFYDYFWVRTVSLKAYTFSGVPHLRVRVEHHHWPYTGPSDYATDEWMRRA